MARYIGRTKTARHMDCSTSTVDRRVREGLISPHKMGDRILFDLDEIDLYLASDVRITPARLAVITAAKKVGVPITVIAMAVGLSEQVIAAVQA